MFVVRPLEDKKMQKDICTSLSVPYEPAALAYYAANLAPDKKTIAEIIGICQFLPKEPAQILTLACPPAFIKDEAMIVLLRAVMYFLHRLGIHKAEMMPDAGSEEILSRSGFLFCDGIYQLDLDVFYQAPCKYESGKE